MSRYMLNIKKGSGKRIKKILESRIKMNGLEELVGNIWFIDDELYSTYMFVDMIKCSKVMDIFKGISGLFGFVGFVDFIEYKDSNNRTHYTKVKSIEPLDKNDLNHFGLN